MNRVHLLLFDELDRVKEVYRSTKEAAVRSRCEMLLLSNQGLTPPQIAERVRFSRRTVTRVIQRYEAEGIKGLHDKPKPGRPRRVTAEYLEKMQSAIDQTPRDLGQAFSNWTTDHLASYLREQTGSTLGARQVENYLKAHRWRLRRLVCTVKPKQNAAQVREKKTPG